MPMAQSRDKILLFVLHACVFGLWIINSKSVLNQSNRIAPSIDPIIQEANLVITRTVNQGFEEKATAQTICAHPEIWIADSNLIRPYE